jgi:hypothetical protein
MDYPALKLAIQEIYPGDDRLTDSEVDNAWTILSKQYTTVPKKSFITYRTIAQIVASPVSLETISATIKATMPTIHIMLTQVGDTDGSAGGIDISHPATAAQIDTLAAAGLFTQAQCDEIKSLGYKNTLNWPGILPSDIRRARSY